MPVSTVARAVNEVRSPPIRRLPAFVVVVVVGAGRDCRFLAGLLVHLGFLNQRNDCQVLDGEQNKARGRAR